MGSMTYGSLTEIPGRIAESNRRPFAPKEELTRFIGIVAGVLLLATQLATAETTSDEDLITLAHKKFTGISDKERKAFDTFFEKTQKGERADLTPDLKHEKDPQMVKILTDPVYADVWEENRVIQAEWLNWLCTDPKASAKVTSGGIEIAGARIEGPVNLAWTRIQFPLRTFKCVFTDKIVLDRAVLRSLHLQGTYIKGLDGDGLNIERDLLFWDGFRSDGPVWLREATIGGSLDCSGGQFISPGGVALNLISTKTSAGLLLKDGFKAEGLVSIYSSTIGGTLECDGGQFINPHATALNLANARTGPVLLWKGFRAEGEVLLDGTVISGNLDCSGGSFINSDVKNKETKRAIYADQIQVEGSVLLSNGFRAQGIVCFRDAKIGADLNCGGGQFINSGGLAIDATAANIQGSVFLNSNRKPDGRVDHFEAVGEVAFRDSRIEHGLLWEDVMSPEKALLDLTFAKVKTLLNERKSWPAPDKLLLNGFIFDEFAPNADWSTKTQINWIRLQKRQEQFISQPYEQLAAVLRNMGLQEEAVEVMIAKNKEHGHYARLFKEIIWYYFFGPFIGFGYQPWNAFYASLFIVAFGFVLFRAGYRCNAVTPTGKDAYVGEDPARRELSEFYPRFNALIYSLETFVPLLKLWMSDYWAPNATRLNRLRILRFELPINGPRLRFYLWCHIILGWILTTLWVGGLTGILKT